MNARVTMAMLWLASLLVNARSGSSPVFADGPATTQATGENLLEATAFKDTKSGIELRLPKGWVLKKGIEDTGYEAPAKERGQGGGLAPNIVLAKNAAPGIKPSDVDAIIAAKRKQYAKLFPAYQDETAGAAVPVVAGKGVGRIDGSYTIAKVLPIQVTQIWIIVDDQVYTITCTSLRETHAANAAIFDAAVKTITIP